ncbi:MAG: enoyl-CoA hydratase/isomerase family protein [Gaiellaceae bacterium]
MISDAASHGAPVELERLDGEVVVVTLSRHAERNALSRDVLEALFEALEVAATGARAMVLTGGPDVFCAGGDLGFLHRALSAGNHAEVRETKFLLVDVVRRLRALPMPTIAAVEGLAVGAGLALAFGADIRIAGRRASFIPGYLAVGASPDGGVSHHLVRTRIVALVLNKRLSSEELLATGLVQEVVDDGAALERAVTVARGLTELSPDALLVTRKVLDTASTLGFDAQLEAEAEAFGLLLDTPAFREAIAKYGGA